LPEYTRSSRVSQECAPDIAYTYRHVTRPLSRKAQLFLLIVFGGNIMKKLGKLIAVAVVAGVATLGAGTASAWWGNDDYYGGPCGGPWGGGPWGGGPGYGYGGYPGYGYGGYPGYGGYGGNPGYGGYGGYPGYGGYGGYGGYPRYAPVAPVAPAPAPAR
jgi:hypothetical protein